MRETVAHNKTGQRQLVLLQYNMAAKVVRIEELGEVQPKKSKKIK